MCRVGIGLYGLQPSETTAPRIALTPAMSVRARVMRVPPPAWVRAWGTG
jgi:alanine racemase